MILLVFSCSSHLFIVRRTRGTINQLTAVRMWKHGGRGSGRIYGNKKKTTTLWVIVSFWDLYTFSNPYKYTIKTLERGEKTSLAQTCKKRGFLFLIYSFTNCVVYSTTDSSASSLPTISPATSSLLLFGSSGAIRYSLTEVRSASGFIIT